MSFVPVPPELLDFIRDGAKFLVAGHLDPDGDCVGSQLALSSVLRRLGKTAIPCSAGPFKRPEVKVFADRFIAQPGEAERAGARVIVLDCSCRERTGDLDAFLKGLPLAIVDHHATGPALDTARSGGGDQDGAGSACAEEPAPLIYLDAEAPSVTFMVLGLIEAMGLSPTAEEAELLFFGLCTDTGFFRHVDNRGAETFSRSSRLIAAGASPKKVYQAIHGGKSLDSRRLMGTVLARTQSFFGGKLLLSWETPEDTALFGAEGRDSDNLYQLLQSVAGVEAIVILRQESPEKCTVGFRSRDAVDVAAIAARFGGGGHKNAAGLSLPGTIEEIRPKILDAFEAAFKEKR